MTSIQTGPPPQRPRAPTRAAQRQKLIDALTDAPTHDLTVHEVLALGIPGIEDIWDAHKLMTDYRNNRPNTIRYDPTPDGTVRVVCLYKTSRRDRRSRV